MTVCIVDSSVLCELLSVPTKSSTQAHEAATNDFETKQREGETFLVPMTVFIEVGNDIAQASNGSQRRKAAERFKEFATAVLERRSPFEATRLPSLDHVELKAWIDDFPDYAMRGVSLGDRGVIATWNFHREVFPRRRVYVWSVDSGLAGYDTDSD